MKRLLWLGVGLAVGALAVRAISKRARTFTPGGLAGAARDTAGGLLDSVRSFVDDVREGMAEREEQIHAAFAEGVALDVDDLDADEFDLDAHDLDPRDVDTDHLPADDPHGNDRRGRYDLERPTNLRKGNA